MFDENPDFGHARDHDLTWPAKEEWAAVLALRAFRDEQIARTP
ncbi:hypothetical protein [Streptomyces phaeofaciens]